MCCPAPLPLAHFYSAPLAHYPAPAAAGDGQRGKPFRCQPESGALDLLLRNKGGVPRIHDLRTAQHLAHDDFNVFFVDFHALQTVHVLHFVGDIALLSGPRTRFCGVGGMTRWARASGETTIDPATYC